MTNLDGLCQGGPEGEKYPKTTRTGKATKKQKGSLDESCESLIVGATDGIEKERDEFRPRNNSYGFWKVKASISDVRFIIVADAIL